MNLINLLKQAESEMDAAGLFFGHGTDNAWDEACLLLAHVLEREYLRDEDSDEQIAPDRQQQFQELIQRRIREKLPAAYLTGQAWFAGYQFEVTPDVLVPRSPIAELIGNHFAPWVSATPKKVLDLCTGSGCIGIAAALELPASSVCLADISAAALGVASANRDRYHLMERVRLVESDLFEQLSDQTFDLIVSNPPYVDRDDLASMPEEFHREPRLGLEAGDDGLDLVRKILLQAPDHLEPGGVLICEVGNSALALEQACPRVPFVWIEFEQGGDGVFMLERDQLMAFRDDFEAAYNAARETG